MFQLIYNNLYLTFMSARATSEPFLPIRNYNVFILNPQSMYHHNLFIPTLKGIPNIIFQLLIQDALGLKDPWSLLKLLRLIPSQVNHQEVVPLSAHFHKLRFLSLNLLDQIMMPWVVDLLDPLSSKDINHLDGIVREVPFLMNDPIRWITHRNEVSNSQIIVHRDQLSAKANLIILIIEPAHISSEAILLIRDLVCNRLHRSKWGRSLPDGISVSGRNIWRLTHTLYGGKALLLLTSINSYLLILGEVNLG